MSAGLGLGLSIIGMIRQRKESEKAAKSARQQADAQRKAEQARQRQSEVDAQRERVKQARENRIKRAQVISSTGNEGLGFSGTSGNVGAVSSVDSQASSNVGYINQQQGFASEISGYNIEAGNAGTSLFTAQAKAAQWQQIGSVGKEIFEGYGGFGTIFGGNTHKTAGKK